MTLKTKKTTRATVQRDVRRVRQLMCEPDIRVFIPRHAREGGVFRARKGGADLVTRLPMEGIEVFLGEGALRLLRETDGGKLYRAVPALRSKRTSANGVKSLAKSRYTQYGLS